MSGGVTVAVGDGVGLGIGLSGAVVASGVGGVVGAGEGGSLATVIVLDRTHLLQIRGPACGCARKGWALQGRVEGCSAGFLIRILPESYSMV